MLHALAQKADVIALSIDTLQFTDVFQNIRALVRKGLVDPELGTISKQAQLLVELCMRNTPPKSAAQGKKRVSADVDKIFHPMDPADFRSPEIARLVRNSDPTAWNAMARNLSTGPLAGTTAVVPTAAIHKANRDRRGRAKRTSFVTLWKQRTTLGELKSAAMSRVGWAKAGWLRAYLGLNGRRVPGYAQKFANTKGIFEDGRGSVDNPYIGAYNDTGWGKAGESKRLVAASMTARSRAMQTYFNTTMRLASEGKPTRWQAQMHAVAVQQSSVV